MHKRNSSIQHKKGAELTNHSGGQGIQACDLWGEVIIVGEGADGRLTHVSQQHCDCLWSHSSLK